MAKQSLLNNYNLRRIMKKKLTIKACISNTWGNTKNFNFFISGNIVNGTNAYKNALRIKQISLAIRSALGIYRDHDASEPFLPINHSQLKLKNIYPKSIYSFDFRKDIEEMVEKNFKNLTTENTRVLFFREREDKLQISVDNLNEDADETELQKMKELIEELCTIKIKEFHLKYTIKHIEEIIEKERPLLIVSQSPLIIKNNAITNLAGKIIYEFYLENANALFQKRDENDNVFNIKLKIKHHFINLNPTETQKEKIKTIVEEINNTLNKIIIAGYSSIYPDKWTLNGDYKRTIIATNFFLIQRLFEKEG